MRSAPLPLLLTTALAACSGSSGSSNPNPDPLDVTFQATTVAPSDAPGSAGRFLPYLIREADEGADLNGDGDQADEVVHILDTATDTTLNLGVATTEPLVLGEDWFAYSRDEVTEGLDLNADFDLLDQVLFAYDLASGLTRPTDLAVGEVLAIGSRAFLEVSEQENGGNDFNGNLSVTDVLFYRLDPATGDLIDTGFDFPGTSFHRRGDTVVFAGPDELYVYDLETGFDRSFDISARDLAGSGDLLAFWVSEADAAEDLNDDLDQDDDVVFIYDFPTSFLRNTRIERTGDVPFAFTTDYVGFAGEFAGAQGVALVDILNVSAEFVPVVPDRLEGIGRDMIVDVDESLDLLDRNGDGDTNDIVPSYLDTTALVQTSLGVATVGMLARGDTVLFSVPESGQGNTDLNGDGDTLDRVLHRLDVPTRTVTNLGLAGGVLGTLGDRFLLLNVSEGAESLNADADTADAVLHVFDLESAEVSNLGLAVEAGEDLLEAAFAEVFPALVPESDQGAADLNGDGDTADLVLHLVEPAN